MQNQNFDFLKNFGISKEILEHKYLLPEVYIIKQEKIKKNFSEGAIYKLPVLPENNINYKAKDDMEIYQECDEEYSILKDSSEHNNFPYFFPRNKDKKINIINYSAVSPYSENVKIKKKFFENSKKSQNFFSNFSDYYKFKENSKNLTTEHEEISPNGKVLKNSNDDALINFVNNNKNNSKNKSHKFHEEKNPSADFLENTHPKHVQTPEGNYLQNLGDIDENEIKDGIYKNTLRNQMNQLERLFQEMNETKEAKVIIRAYKSKLKTKFYKIYESNSEFFKEKNKFKIFHKCNFPGCARTFASAGWLRSHFFDHLSEIKMHKFNLEFERELIKSDFTKLF